MLVCNHGRPIGCNSRLKQCHDLMFQNLVMRSRFTTIMNHETEEVVEGNHDTGVAELIEDGGQCVGHLVLVVSDKVRNTHGKRNW